MMEDFPSVPPIVSPPPAPAMQVLTNHHHQEVGVVPSPQVAIISTERRPICRKVLKIVFWKVPPADWLIL